MLSSAAGNCARAARDTEEYERILNDPLCRIIRSRDVKENIKDYDNGKLISSIDQLYVIVEWEENTLR